jgi:hypothetical protein
MRSNFFRSRCFFTLELELGFQTANDQRVRLRPGLVAAAWQPNTLFKTVNRGLYSMIPIQRTSQKVCMACNSFASLKVSMGSSPWQLLVYLICSRTMITLPFYGKGSESKSKAIRSDARLRLGNPGF